MLRVFSAVLMATTALSFAAWAQVSPTTNACPNNLGAWELTRLGLTDGQRYKPITYAGCTAYLNGYREGRGQYLGRAARDGSHSGYDLLTGSGNWARPTPISPTSNRFTYSRFNRGESPNDDHGRSSSAGEGNKGEKGDGYAERTQTSDDAAREAMGKGNGSMDKGLRDAADKMERNADAAREASRSIGSDSAARGAKGYGKGGEDGRSQGPGNSKAGKSDSGGYSKGGDDSRSQGPGGEKSAREKMANDARDNRAGAQTGGTKGYGMGGEDGRSQGPGNSKAGKSDSGGYSKGGDDSRSQGPGGKGGERDSGKSSGSKGGLGGEDGRSQGPGGEKSSSSSSGKSGSSGGSKSSSSGPGSANAGREGKGTNGSGPQ